MPIPDPLIILAPPRSYTTLVGTMLGQHPQMYGLLETFLFRYATVQEWWAKVGRTVWSHGLLRVVAEVIMGAQTEATIELARRWLWRRSHWGTGRVLRTLAGAVVPLGLVEKSPMPRHRVEYVQRAQQVFPGARFLHLVRHPIGQGQSIIEEVRESYGGTPSMPDPLIARLYDFSINPPILDPQVQWCKVHLNICAALAAVPPGQQMRIRGEDLLADPDRHLREIAAWLGLRSDPEAIEAMKHPERSPFARIGPRNAPLGGDSKFLKQPALRARTNDAASLEGPLPWRKDGVGFIPQVRELAQRFGYT